MFEIHPAANVFPMMTAEELDDLAIDIVNNGLREPIVLTPDGLLLDGRNRATVCRQMDIEPKTVVYDGEPVAFVISENLLRRHMTKGQRAMSAALLLKSNGDEETQESAARRVGVSRQHVSRATVVLEWAPDLAPLVLDGSRQLNDANEEATERKNEKATEEELIERLRWVDSDLASDVVEGIRTLEDANAIIKVRERIAELPVDLAERVEAAQLAVDEAETILKERRDRSAAWADNLRDAMRRLARMASDPIPEELAAQFTEDEQAVLVTILDALMGATMDSWAEYKTEIDKLLDEHRPERAAVSEKEWREPVDGWARNHIPDETNLVRTFAEQTVDIREREATKAGNGLLRMFGHGQAPLFWSDLGPKPIKVGKLRIRLDVATPDDVEDAALELERQGKRTYDEVVMLGVTLRELAREARRQGFSTVAQIGDLPPWNNPFADFDDDESDDDPDV